MDYFEDPYLIVNCDHMWLGEPGVDYPTLASVPDTDFSCDNRISGGYYADVQTNCQVIFYLTLFLPKILLLR